MKKVGVVYINNKTQEKKVHAFEVKDEIADEIYLKMSSLQDDDIEPDTPLADLLLATKYIARLNGWYELPSFQILAPENSNYYFEKAKTRQS